MGKKILIIPSWYPTPNQPLRGSFFQEQAQFLQGKEGLDFQILYGEKKSFSLIRWIWIFVKSYWKSSWPISSDKVTQNPNAYGFDLPANRRIPDRLQILLENSLYIKAYRSLKKSGWVPDLIHAQSGMDAGIYASSINQKEKVPYVIIEHQVVVFHHYSKLRASLILEAYRNAIKLGAVSLVQKRQMLVHEPECSPLVIPNLINEEDYLLKMKSDRNPIHILTVMYSHPIKGYKTFFEALGILKEYQFNFRFTVIGQGGDIFRMICEKSGVLNLGRFLERVDRTAMPQYFQEADVYVCSSDFETFGIAPRESMISGLPVVSTANGGVEESIQTETGIVVPVRDPTALAAAILQIKNNYSSYQPEVIREYAIRQFGRNSFLKSMLEFYPIEN